MIKRLFAVVLAFVVTSCAEVPLNPGSDTQFAPPLNMVKENEPKAKITVTSKYLIGNRKGFKIIIYGGSAERCDGQIYQTLNNVPGASFYLPVGRPTSVSTLSVYTPTIGPIIETRNCKQTFTITPMEGEYIVESDYALDKKICTLAIARQTASGLVSTPEARIRKESSRFSSSGACEPD